MSDTIAPLSHRLRNETKNAHTRAERSGVMRDILRGDASVGTYTALMRDLHAVYVALEHELARHASHPSLAFVDLRSVARGAAIEADLSALADDSWRDMTVTSAAGEYAARLHMLGDTDPERLLAHAYLRYLGDLSGGQMMRGIVARTLSVSEAPGTRGLAFYDFPLIGDPAEFKNAFRKSLDGIPAKPDSIVNEAQLGYELHARMFEELEANVSM